MVSPRLAVALLAATLLAPGASHAEGEAAERACGDKAGLYGGDKPFRLWVSRQGTMRQENPLRPLTPDELTVLQVVVNGRIATAFGPDTQNLRQGGGPQQLEGGAVEPIRWAPSSTALPDAIRIVAEDGAVLFGPLRFLACTDAPKATAVAGPSQRRPPRDAGARPGGGGKAARPAAEPRPAVPPGFALPQGAID